MSARHPVIGPLPMDPHYNEHNHPIRLTRTTRNHDIWGDPETGWCAAIPTHHGGPSCRASGFGDMWYFNGHASRCDPADLTEAGKAWVRYVNQHNATNNTEGTA